MDTQPYAIACENNHRWNTGRFMIRCPICHAPMPGDPRTGNVREDALYSTSRQRVK